MKKVLSFLLAALLLLGSAFALERDGYPSFDAAALPANAFGGTFDAERLLLEFDASAEFSMAANGYMQACFYAMNGSGESYIEIYLLFPQNIASGDVLTPDSMRASGSVESGVSFYEVLESQEIFYVAMQDGKGKYPENSDYEIRIESFADTGAAYAVHGTLTATLAELQELRPTGRTIALRDAEFDFALPKSAAPQPGTPEPTQAPFEFVIPDASDAPFDFIIPQPSDAPFAFAMPEPTHAPAGSFAAFTLPPDYAKI